MYMRVCSIEICVFQKNVSRKWNGKPALLLPLLHYAYEDCESRGVYLKDTMALAHNKYVYLGVPKKKKKGGGQPHKTGWWRQFAKPKLKSGLKKMKYPSNERVEWSISICWSFADN